MPRDRRQEDRMLRSHFWHLLLYREYCRFERENGKPPGVMVLPLNFKEKYAGALPPPEEGLWGAQIVFGRVSRPRGLLTAVEKLNETEQGHEENGQ